MVRLRCWKGTLTGECVRLYPGSAFSSSRFWESLIDPRHDPPADHATILLPVGPVLGQALGMIAALAMKQQDEKVHKVEIRQGVFEQARKTPGQCHEEVA